MEFQLHPNLASKKFIIDLPLCKVLLEDESQYPWIFLVPRRPCVGKIMDLSREDQLLLLTELDWAQQVLWENFCPIQLNVAAIGNKTPQLHVHVIARQNGDPAWPGTVWDHSVKCPYTSQGKDQMVALLLKGFLQKRDQFIPTYPSSH
jgi:diadenosine tetraphosphate (Ap4A) HIT family hydrolase